MLTAAILQIVSLWLNVQDYLQIAAAGVLSPDTWRHYSQQQTVRCINNILVITIFFGILIISFFAKSYKAARLSEGVLLALLAAGWFFANLILDITGQTSYFLYWAFILIVTIIGAAVSFYKGVKEDR